MQLCNIKVEVRRPNSVKTITVEIPLDILSDSARLHEVAFKPIATVLAEQERIERIEVDGVKFPLFMECAECNAKPGSPPLCESCLHNRGVVERLTGRMEGRGPVRR